MKLNKMFIASILLLAIIAMGAVSASEEISDDVAAIEPTDDVIAETVDEEVTDDVIAESVDDIEPADEEPLQAVEEEEIQENMDSNEELADINDEFSVEIGYHDQDDYMIYLVSEGNRNGTCNIYVNDSLKLSLNIEDGYFDSSKIISPYGYSFSSKETFFMPDELVAGCGIYNIKVKFIEKETDIEVLLKEKNVSVVYCTFDRSCYYIGADESFSFEINFPNLNSGNVVIYERVYDDEAQETKNVTLGSASIANGKAVIEIAGLDPNTSHSIYVDYTSDVGNGSEYFYPYVLKNVGDVAVTVPSEITVGEYATLTLNAKFPGKIWFSVDGKLIYCEDYSALKYLIPDLSVGTHNVRVVFIGNRLGSNQNGVPVYDAVYIKNFKITVKEPAPAPASTPAVKKLATKIVAAKKTFKVKTKVKKYTITLKAGKKLVKKVKLTLKVGKKTYKATTNSKGKATFKIKNLKKKGKYTAVIKFAGNKNYKASTKKVKITVKK